MTTRTMAVHQAKPTETKAKLEMNLGVRRHVLGALERERMRLTLPAHSGDEAAVERLRNVRAEIGAEAAVIEDLTQALIDIEPQVRGQRAAEVLERKQQMADRWDCAMDRVFHKLERIDEAANQFVAMVVEASEEQEAARRLLVDLLVPVGADVTHTVFNRMLAFDNTGFKSLPVTAAATVAELLETGHPDLRSAMAPVIAQTKAAADQRIREVLARHEREARAAGPELPVEAEAAA